MKRDTRTLTFWTSAEPPPMLPRGQMDLPLVQAPKAEPIPAKLNPPPCSLEDGHAGRCVPEPKIRQCIRRDFNGRNHIVRCRRVALPGRKFCAECEVQP